MSEEESMVQPPVLVTMTVNDRAVQAWLPANTTLMTALRDNFGATDVKYGCGEGVCGTCTVMLDGELVNSCLVFAIQCEGGQVQTMAGLVDGTGGMHPLQQSFLEHGASQCGFCTPGMVMTALAHAQAGGRGDRGTIRDALAGNLCRCTGYVKIVDAVEDWMASAGTGSVE